MNYTNGYQNQAHLTGALIICVHNFSDNPRTMSRLSGEKINKIDIIFSSPERKARR